MKENSIFPTFGFLYVIQAELFGDSDFNLLKPQNFTRFRLNGPRFRRVLLCSDNLGIFCDVINQSSAWHLNLVFRLWHLLASCRPCWSFWNQGSCNFIHCRWWRWKDSKISPGSIRGHCYRAARGDRHLHLHRGTIDTIATKKTTRKEEQMQYIRTSVFDLE